MYETKGAANGASTAPVEDQASSNGRKAGALTRARRAVLSDDRLAKQAAAGDVGAFEAIFSRHQDDLYRFCVGILREPQDAQDAVQNTMVKAMRALPGERRQMQLKPWLYRIAHNESVELRRRERPVEELPVTVDDASALTDERAEENGRLRTLLADIADLPERQRAVLVLREVNGLGFGEIGATLGTSPGAVRQALYEARRGLAEMENGRDMQCDRATRMVSDADGRPRDRGVRAHLRDCSPCRRFQAEITERGHTFAAIAPMPAIAAVAALKAALAGSGGAAGGSGAAAVAGGAGAGAGTSAVGVAGSIGASALVKPAAGLLVALAVGTAAVDRGGIVAADGHDAVAADPGRSAPALVEHAARSAPGESHAIVLRTGRTSATGPSRDRVDWSSTPAPAPSAAVSNPAAEGPVDSASAPRPRGGGDPQGGAEAAKPTVPNSPALDDTSYGGPVVQPDPAPVAAPESDAAPPGQDKRETVPRGQAKKKAETTAEPAQTPESTVPETTGPEAPARVPPGQAKKETVPQGQAKKLPAPALAPTTSESSVPESAPAGPAPHVPPGQAKKEVESAPAVEPSEVPAAPVETTEAAKVPPGQAKKEAAATE